MAISKNLYITKIKVILSVFILINMLMPVAYATMYDELSASIYTNCDPKLDKSSELDSQRTCNIDNGWYPCRSCLGQNISIDNFAVKIKFADPFKYAFDSDRPKDYSRTWIKVGDTEWLFGSAFKFEQDGSKACVAAMPIGITTWPVLREDFEEFVKMVKDEEARGVFVQTTGGEISPTNIPASREKIKDRYLTEKGFSPDCYFMPEPRMPLQPPNWGTYISKVCTDYTTGAAKSDYPFISVVTQCVEDTIMNIFLNQDVNGQTLFSQIQNNLKSIVTAILTIYVILFGYKFVIKPQGIKQADAIWFFLKAILVVYFSIGPGTRELLPSFISATRELSSMMMDSSFDSLENNPQYQTARTAYRESVNNLNRQNPPSLTFYNQTLEAQTLTDKIISLKDNMVKNNFFNLSNPVIVGTSTNLNTRLNLRIAVILINSQKPNNYGELFYVMNVYKANYGKTNFSDISIKNTIDTAINNFNTAKNSSNIQDIQNLQTSLVAAYNTMDAWNNDVVKLGTSPSLSIFDANNMAKALSAINDLGTSITNLRNSAWAQTPSIRPLFNNNNFPSPNVSAAKTALDADLRPYRLAISGDPNAIPPIVGTLPALRVAMNNLSGFNYCDFRGYDYTYQDTDANGRSRIRDMSYMRIWDTFDCKIARYLGIGYNDANKYVPQTVLIAVAAIISHVYGLPIFIITIALLIYILMLIARIAHIYLMAVIIIIMLVYISPLLVPTILFERTKNMFDIWFKGILGYILQPMFLFTFVALLFLVMDYSIYGKNHAFYPPDTAVEGVELSNRIILEPDPDYPNNRKKGKCYDPDTIACIFEKVTFSKTVNFGVGADFTFTALDIGYKEGEIIFISLLKLLLICFIFHQVIGKVEDLSKTITNALAGGAGGLSDAPLVAPNAILSATAKTTAKATQIGASTALAAPGIAAAAVRATMVPKLLGFVGGSSFKGIKAIATGASALSGNKAAQDKIRQAAQSASSSIKKLSPSNIADEASSLLTGTPSSSDVEKMQAFTGTSPITSSGFGQGGAAMGAGLSSGQVGKGVLSQKPSGLLGKAKQPAPPIPPKPGQPLAAAGGKPILPPKPSLESIKNLKDIVATQKPVMPQSARPVSSIPGVSPAKAAQMAKQGIKQLGKDAQKDKLPLNPQAKPPLSQEAINMQRNKENHLMPKVAVNPLEKANDSPLDKKQDLQKQGVQRPEAQKPSILAQNSDKAEQKTVEGKNPAPALPPRPDKAGLISKAAPPPLPPKPVKKPSDKPEEKDALAPEKKEDKEQAFATRSDLVNPELDKNDKEESLEEKQKKADLQPEQIKLEQKENLPPRIDVQELSNSSQPDKDKIISDRQEPSSKIAGDKLRDKPKDNKPNNDVQRMLAARQAGLEPYAERVDEYGNLKPEQKEPVHSVERQVIDSPLKPIEEPQLRERELPNQEPAKDEVGSGSRNFRDKEGILSEDVYKDKNQDKALPQDIDKEVVITDVSLSQIEEEGNKEEGK